MKFAQESELISEPVAYVENFRGGTRA